MNNPVPAGDAFDSVGRVFEIASRGNQVVFEGVDTVEDAVVDMLFP